MSTKLLNLIIELIMFGVEFARQKEFNDERLEIIHQFNLLLTDVSGALVIYGPAIPLIAALIYIVCRLRVAYN